MFAQPRHLRWLAAVVLLGCGEAQLSNTEAGVAVTSSADALCLPLAEGDALIGVSPEGEAWVEGDDGIRHILPDGTTTVVDAGFTRADALVAWDRQSAFVVGDNSLWSTTFDGAQAMVLPPELGKPRFLCGDPGRASGSFLVTTRGLFERLDDVWFRWSFPVELLESIQIRDLLGACSGQEPVMYVEAGDLLWEVRYGERASFREAADLTGMTAVGPDVRVGFIAIREGELFRFDGAGWASIPFDEGSVTAASAADGVLWVAVDGLLYRRDRFDQWKWLDAPMWPTPIDEVRGYAAGGAWVVRADQLCHVEPRETLRMSGLRPYGRLPEGSGLAVSVYGEPSTQSSLQAQLDGQSVQVGRTDDHWTVTGPESLDPGWHTLCLSLSSNDRVARRTSRFFVEGDESGEPPIPPPGEPTVFWEDDIRPIYERSCSACHGEAGIQTFMGSFEAFAALGELALERVSQGEMPPTAANNVEPLSEAEVQLLETWVQEGMNP